MANIIASILGAGSLLIGIIGFIAPNFLGLHLSVAHNLVHILTGIAALGFGILGSRAGARLFDISFGAVYGLLGVVGFLLGTAHAPGLPGAAGMPMGVDTHLFRLIPGVLEFGTSDHVVHLLLGFAFLAVGLLSRGNINRVVEVT